MRQIVLQWHILWASVKHNGLVDFTKKKGEKGKKEQKTPGSTGKRSHVEKFPQAGDQHYAQL